MAENLTRQILRPARPQQPAPYSGVGCSTTCDRVAAEASRRSSLMHALGAARATGWPISLALELEKPDPAALASRIGKLRDVIRLEEEI